MKNFKTVSITTGVVKDLELDIRIQKGEIILLDETCPCCGERLYAYNNPSDDPTLGEYCSDPKCDYFRNQFVSYEEIMG